MPKGLISGSCTLFVLTFITVAICLRNLYGPHIRQLFSSRIAALGARYIDNENCIYIVFIYHAEEDVKTALDIKKKLTDRDYKVSITADMEGNQNIISTFSERTAVFLAF